MKLATEELHKAKTICLPMGCFSNDNPYSSRYRPLTLFPQSPESINTQFFLFTKNNTDQYQVISAKNLTTLRKSNFDGSKKTVYVVHGYTETGNDTWLVNVCQSILQKEDVNCICVDWSGGSSAIYNQAVNNVQVVGAEISCFINVTLDHFNASLSKIHLIGHSLGAHVVGEAGKRRPRIARIIGLDAAGPYFEGTPAEVSLDPTDANFVVGIHTNTAIIGIKQLVGHIDFFLNGGERMPGCSGQQLTDIFKAPTLVTAARDVFLCSHVASYYVFLATILNPDGFMGYCATNYASFQAGAQFPCPNGSCSLMGYYTEAGNAGTCRTYYLNTGPRSDYERWRYNVTIETTGDVKHHGSLAITLCDRAKCSDKTTIYSGHIVAGSVYSALIDVPIARPDNGVTFIWRKTFLSFSTRTLGAASVTLQRGNDGTVYKFCGNETTRDGISQTLPPCP
ncbi:pancreatic lipase-related protein 2-like isoform X2 [Mixophyes fleayi]|uniref:pancreatic lipase-related protein 2-like isoform X2 n=1 Tax=Mixophyes fleayi TaxID=3061075 RepID=UPI003F4E0600